MRALDNEMLSRAFLMYRNHFLQKNDRKYNGGLSMGEVLEIEQNLRLNPYVTQTEKLVESLQCLSHLFQKTEREKDRKGVSRVNRLDELGEEIQVQLCCRCSQGAECKTRRNADLQEMIREIIEELDEYGLELSVSNKRAFEKRCTQFEELKEKVEQNFRISKSDYVWEERLVENKQASFVILQAMLKTLEETTKEIDASIFRDERLERRISRQFKRMGVRTLKVMLFVSDDGIYEVHISAKAKGGTCVTTAQMGEIVSRVLGRKLEPEYREGYVLKEGYDTVVFVERPRYQVLCGMAKHTKEGSVCSGDNFLVLDCAGGKKCIMISDGMGSGEGAFRQSQLVLELAEILLESGVPPSQTIDMINAWMVWSASEVAFATLDMGIIDMYQGKLELIKAGTATTYVVSDHFVRSYEASSLPIGVITKMQLNHFKMQLSENSYVIMATDGVMEGILEEERETFIRRIIKEIRTKNPTEIGARILEKALEAQAGVAKDDMMVLVLGVWEL